MIELAASPAAARRWSSDVHLAGELIGLVPTMGALHEGHLHLIETARERAARVAVSIFVNPLQFDRADDFGAYPRPIDDDLDACRAMGVDLVYAPTPDAMYPAGFQTHVEPGELSARLEGAMRPGHFRGVTTVVTKLLTAVRPDLAVFGEKDLQQLAIVRRLVTDLDLGVEIVGAPTVREPDGLALSSRNRRLDHTGRRTAATIPRSLAAAARAYAAGERSPAELAALVQRHLADGGIARVDYVEVVDEHDLRPVSTALGEHRVVLAAWVGEVRLIDNCRLDRPPVTDALGG